MRRVFLVYLAIVLLLMSCSIKPQPSAEPTLSTAAVPTRQKEEATAVSPTMEPTRSAAPQKTAMPTSVPLPKPVLDQFIITFWTPPNITHASLRQIADGGFNLVMANVVSPSYGKKLLDWAQELGLKVMVTDPVLSPYRMNLEPDIQDITSAYKDHPALWGYYLTDEPGADLFADFARLNRLLLENDPNHFPYINLFPNYAVASQLGTEDYAGYIRTFIEVVQPAILSYDHYALTPNGDQPGYYANLEVIRSEALLAGIPFMQIILATPFPGVRDVTAADLRYQVYTTLAYGAKGISYFTYAVPGASTFGDGLLDRAGNKTAKWEAAREINLEVAQLGKWLLGLESTGVYYTQPPEPECAPIADSSLVLDASGGKLQLGEFIDEAGARWLMVVNLDRDKVASARLTLGAEVTAVQMVDKTTGALVPLVCADAQACRQTDAGYTLTLEFAPADGVLLRLD
ncbi:MAG: hypothetical protein LLG44_11255 [Chloroflexi bacterium]|nr:hypothetical protein [Chloroflexota bacterium]